MLALDPGVILALAPDILLRALPNQRVYYAFNVATGDHFRLNRTSFWVLETIGRGVEWEPLTARFLDTFDVSPDDGKADLEAITNQLLQEQIVRKMTDGEAKD